jgi:hypothetical protein
MDKRARSPSDYLARHSLDRKERTRLMSWMLEVMMAYKQPFESFYLASAIVDQFYQATPTYLTCN